MELLIYSNFLPPATKLGQGYIFTGVCDSVQGGEGSGPLHARIHTTPRPEAGPPGTDPPGTRHPPGSRHPPGTIHPPSAVHAGRY